MTAYLFDGLTIPNFRGDRAGRDFEETVLKRLSDEEKNGNGCYDRAGVKAAIRKRNTDGTVVAQVMKSRPDIDGVTPGGRQVVFDCKVCSGASFNMSEYREDIGSRQKSSQLKFMRRRSKCKAICGFLIHWNSRELKTKEEPAETFFLPVDYRMRLWRQFVDCELTTITRDHCATYGFRIPWTKGKRESNFRPDVVSCLLHLAGESRVKNGGG